MPSINLTISEGLLDHLKRLFLLGLEDVVKNNALEGMNGFTSFAIPAYIISVTVVEAFLNEMFISQAGRSYFRGSEASDFWRDIQKEKLIKKLVLDFCSNTLATQAWSRGTIGQRLRQHSHPMPTLSVEASAEKGKAEKHSQYRLRDLRFLSAETFVAAGF